MAQSPTTARIRQRRRQRLILVLLLLIGLLAAGGYFLLKPGTAKKTQEVRPKGTIAIPYAKTNINVGTRVDARMVGARFVKPHEVPSDAILAYSQFNFRIATRQIIAGSYFRESDFSAAGAPNSFSGIARPGHRIVVVPSTNLVDIGYIREGDMVDILAISNPFAAMAAMRGARASAGATTIQGGGTQPGAGGQVLNRTTGPIAGMMNPDGMKATLVAENAKVVVAPQPRRGSQNVVLEMLPQDAHVTMLALGSGQNLRLVFRHFKDDGRITPDAPVTDTTYIPRGANSVELIVGSNRRVQNIRMENAASEMEPTDSAQ